MENLLDAWVAPKVARYVVIVERYLTDEPGGDNIVGHPVSGSEAVAQLVRELDEAWNDSGVAGWFHITDRTIEDETVDEKEVTRRFADDPGYLDKEAQIVRGEIGGEE